MQRYQQALEHPPTPLSATDIARISADVLHPYKPEAWPQGIFENGPADLPPAVYHIENEWQTDSYGSHLQVYAGSIVSDPSQGVIAVHVTSLDGKSAEGHDYLTPSKHGAVRIVLADGPQLQLISKDGTRFTFDVGTRIFVAPTALPTWPSGILAYGQAAFPAGLPFAANVYRIDDLWQGEWNGSYVRVFAGSPLADPSQGLAIVQGVPLSLWPAAGANYQVFRTSSRAGSLRITAASGGRLDLLSASGTSYSFDLTSDQLVASVAPPATPQPPTPAPQLTP